MDNRYLERGYAAEFREENCGAFLAIYRQGILVSEIGVGVFDGGPQSPVSVIIKRFQPGELRKVVRMDYWR